MKTNFPPCSRLRLAVVGAFAAIFFQPAVRAEEATAKTIVIVGNDTLKFSVTRIEASPGQSIHIQFRNEGSMPKETMGHNWILLDRDDEVTPYAAAAISAHDTGYMPKALADHVLAFVPLLGPKESGDVTFNAPAKPGKYPFICSSPAHAAAGMRGELIVK
jgi:azurin